MSEYISRQARYRMIHCNFKNNCTLRETSALNSVNHFLIKHGHGTKWEGSDSFNDQHAKNLLSNQYVMIRKCKCFHSYFSSIVVAHTETGSVYCL